MNPLLAIAAAASVALVADAHAATKFRIRCLDCTYQATYGHSLYPAKINNANVIVANDASTGQGYVLYQGTITPTPVLPGYATSSANDINDNGHVVGNQVSGTNATEGYLWDGATVTMLGALAGYPGSDAEAINDQDQVTGWSGTSSSGASLAFLYQDGVMAALPPLGPQVASWGAGINAAGHVVGASLGPAAGALPKAWVEADGQTYPLARRFLSSRAWAINDQDQMAGSVDSYAAFWDSAGKQRLLNTVPGFSTGVAWGINNCGDVVGILLGNNSAGWPQIAFIYDGVKVRDMNDLILGGAASGWFLNVAYSINDAGVVVGVGTLNGARRSFVAVPVSR